VKADVGFLSLSSKKEDANQNQIDKVAKMRKNPNKIELELSENLPPKKPYKNSKKSKASKKRNILFKTLAKPKTRRRDHLTAW